MITAKKVTPKDWLKVLLKMDFYKRPSGFVDYDFFGELTFFDINPKIDGINAFYVTREDVLTYLKEELIWTDNLVLKFAKVSTQGLYGDYKNAKTIKEKLEIFKIINNITKKQKNI